METLVRNPETGRWIKKEGTVYKALVKKGVKVPSKPSRQRRAFIPEDLEQRDVHPSLQQTYKVDKSDVSWLEKKPHTPKQRKELMEKCKESCFLLPEKKKFPICNKIVPRTKKCSYNCKGIKAAASRAGEWKYNNVLEKAKATATKLDCYVKKKKNE